MQLQMQKLCTSLTMVLQTALYFQNIKSRWSKQVSLPWRMTRKQSVADGSLVVMGASGGIGQVRRLRVTSQRETSLNIMLAATLPPLEGLSSCGRALALRCRQYPRRYGRSLSYLLDSRTYFNNPN